MVYNILEYRCVFYPELSQSTVLRMIHKGEIPANHRAIMGRKIMIEIKGFDDGLNDYFNACVEFNERKLRIKDTSLHELAAEIVIKYDISMTKFCKMNGI